MFSDIRLFIDNKKIDYEYQLENGVIKFITIADLELEKKLKIFYDENIYEIITNSSFNEEKKGEVYISIDKKKVSFNVKLKNSFIAKSIYEYINKFSSKEKLMEKIKIFLEINKDTKYVNDLKELLNSLENIDDKEYDDMFNILVQNKTFNEIMDNMSNLELMLLITAYISVPNPPIVEQEQFNLLVNEAINYDHSLENVWRLAMNYDSKDYNYDLIDEFFINSKDSYYLIEYIGSIWQIDKEKIIETIVKDNDTLFIQKLLENEIFIRDIDEEQLKRLNELIENK